MKFNTYIMKFRKFFKIQSFNNFKYDKFKVDKDLIKKYNEDVLTIEKDKRVYIRGSL